jgi:hypothetical protein
MGGTCSRNGDKNAYESLVEKPGGKRQVGRTRQRWEDVIKRDLKDMGCEWTSLVQYRNQLRAVVNMVTNLCVTGYKCG